jgi:SAM-dependent methyltransferase
MPQNDHAHDAHHSGDDASMGELLDLAADAMRATLVELTAWIALLMADQPPIRILDLGAGTGAGTMALIERFPAATVAALDSSDEMLRRIREKADAAGVAERVHAMAADLDLAWPDAPPADLVWASDSLHHAADPDATLRRAFDALRPGGLMALIEPEDFAQFLPGDLGIGRPGLEARLRERVAVRRSSTHPQLGTDWGPRLTGAGFVIAEYRRLDIAVAGPLDAGGRRYAETALRRDRDRVRDELDRDDLDTWSRLLDQPGPESVHDRGDVGIRATRSVWMARRP